MSQVEHGPRSGFHGVMMVTLLLVPGSVAGRFEYGSVVSIFSDPLAVLTSQFISAPPASSSASSVESLSAVEVGYRPEARGMS